MRLQCGLCVPESCRALMLAHGDEMHQRLVHAFQNSRLALEMLAGALQRTAILEVKDNTVG